MRVWLRQALTLGLLVTGTSRAAAQQGGPVDTTRCDSIVTAARVDSIAVSLKGRAFAIGDIALPAGAEEWIVSAVTSTFVPPRPFRLSVFESGAPAMRTLKASAVKSVLRAPTVTGIYRFTLHTDGTVSDLSAARESMIPGFDSSVVSAIDAAARAKEFPHLEDTVKQVRVEFRFTTESLPGGYPVVTAFFPRMMMVDAAGRPENPPAEYPAAERADSIEGDAVLSFIVARSGRPIPSTVMLVRGTTRGFVTAALAALPAQVFTPATIAGCPVAQVVEYPFTFVLPRGEGRGARGEG